MGDEFRSAEFKSFKANEIGQLRKRQHALRRLAIKLGVALIAAYFALVVFVLSQGAPWKLTALVVALLLLAYCVYSGVRVSKPLLVRERVLTDIVEAIDSIQQCRDHLSSPTLKDDISRARNTLKKLELDVGNRQRTYGFKREQALLQAFRTVSLLSEKKVKPVLTLSSSAKDYDEALALLDKMFVALYTDDDANFSQLQQELPPTRAETRLPGYARLMTRLSGGVGKVLLVLGSSLLLFLVWWLVDVIIGKPFDLGQAILVAGAFAAVCVLLDWCYKELLPKAKS